MSEQGPPSDAESNKHLALASAYVQDAWFPVDSGVLETVQSRLYQGAYDQDRIQLVHDLKQDSSLFLFCLRRLSEIMSQGSAAGGAAYSPHDLLHNSEISQVREALAIDSYKISTHHNDRSQETHVRCCERSVISATTAEALSPHYDVTSTDAYACALLRQLGLTLIAWNYPHVYSRVVASLKSGENPDPLLQKMLGFSPKLLAISVAKRWNLSPPIIDGMDSEAVKSSSTQSTALALSKICEIGEAFAECINETQIENPRWQGALDVIEEHLGPRGIFELKRAIGRNLSMYAKRHPELANWQESPVQQSIEVPPQRPGRTITAPRGEPLKLLPLNLYVKRCSDAEQSKFGELYAAIDHANPKTALELLRSSIVPLFGFERGCIFLLEPDNMNLVPRLPLGSSSISEFSPVRFSSSQSAFDPIVAAYSSKTPSIEERVSPAGNKVLYIACSLGELQRAGVLYLELGSEQAQARRGTSPLIAFKAIRHALADILALK